jgi:hypothetical protein
MGLGMSLFLIAVGAILRYAVTFDVVGVDIHVVGVILLLIGILGLILSLIFMFIGSGRSERVEQTPYRDPRYRDRS